MTLLYVIAAYLVLFAAAKLWDRISKERRMKAELSALRAERVAERAATARRAAELDSQEAIQLQEASRRTAELGKREVAIEQLAAERTKGFPWLAAAYADFLTLELERKAAALDSKRHPAHKAAAEVRAAAKRAREAEMRARTLEYQMHYYESLFPWLAEFREIEAEDLDALAALPAERMVEEAGSDPASVWLSKEEYAKLPATERYQRALDRYLSNRKTRWQVGRDYERYVGFLLEGQGYRVEYRGAIEGFADLGRDLIAVRPDDLLVVQCKRWAAQKTIHEKHIFQLYGTCLEYQMQLEDGRGGQLLLDNTWNPGTPVRPWFCTSTVLSDTARRMAGRLGVGIAENLQPSTYPLIKCNISYRGGERIYHLPFDQQYDRVVIDPSRGECYTATVADAEARGFRRAWRWRGVDGHTTAQPG